jgi:hypothetical protein
MSMINTEPAKPAEAETAPLAFVSHASEDKVSFVEPLARALYKRGVRAWLDKWEMSPEDSVIAKIFDEGIAKADCFVVVVSRHSVGKRWVREELDSAMVERINRRCRLIPIRLGEIEMPPPLRATIWIDAAGSEEAAAVVAAEEIARVLQGHDPRPALGQPAAYLTHRSAVAGLAADESMLLTRLAEQALRSMMPAMSSRLHGYRAPGVNWPEFLKAVEADGISETTAAEAAHALHYAGYFELVGSLQTQLGLADMTKTTRINRLQLTSLGLAAALPALRPDWEALRTRVIAELVNEPPADIAALAERVDAPPLIVYHFVDELRDQGLLKFSHSFSGRTRIHGISPALRRLTQ